jgi:Right handed beta helix region
MTSLLRRLITPAVLLTASALATTGFARAATFTVSNTNDSGSGSLRDAITMANASPAVPNTINFSVSGTITLGSDLPAIDNTSPGSLTINGNGQAITIAGAGMFQVFVVNSGATLSLESLTVADGFITGGGHGGGIYNAGTLSVNEVTLLNNLAGSGGGIYNDGGSVTVTDSTFSGGAGDGGGLSNGDGVAAVTGSTFTASQSRLQRGSAVFVGAGTVTITNSTFAQNVTVEASGCLYNNGGTLTLENDTISNNTQEGGAIVPAAGTTSVSNTVLSSNSPADCESIGVTNGGFNIADDSSCGFGTSTGASGQTIGDGVNPLLDPAGLQNNGGPTETIALLSTSPAIAAIPVGDCPSTDQRGDRRPAPGQTACDIGAFELQVERLFVVPGSEMTQIARSTASSDADQVNMTFTFTDIGSPVVDDGSLILDDEVALHCDTGTDALNGITVDLYQGTCTSLPTSGGLLLDLAPFAVHTVGSVSYGTFFQSALPETVSARIVQLETPEDTCGEWTLNIEVAGLDTAALGLSGNPFALVLEDSDKNAGCFDITNAIVGNQIDPPGRKVRRAVRR